MSEGIVTCTEKTDCIIFDDTALIQMLPVLSETVKVISVAIVEQFRGYILKTSCIYQFISQILIVFNMYKEKSLNTLA